MVGSEKPASLLSTVDLAALTLRPHGGGVAVAPVVPEPTMPVVSVSVTGSLAEGGTMTVTLTASQTSALPMTIGDLSVGPGNAPALNAADFGGSWPSWANVTITPGQLIATRTFAATNDSDVEPDEGGRVTASNPVNCTIGTATADFTVLNNDVGGSGPAAERVADNFSAFGATVTLYAAPTGTETVTAEGWRATDGSWIIKPPAGVAVYLVDTPAGAGLNPFAIVTDAGAATANSPYAVTRDVHGAQWNPGNRADVGGATASNRHGPGQAMDSADNIMNSTPIGDITSSTTEDYVAALNVSFGKTGNRFHVPANTAGTFLKAISNIPVSNGLRRTLAESVPFTFVTAAPALPDAIRPSQSEAAKPLQFYKQDLNLSAFGNHPLPPSAPSVAACLAAINRAHWMGTTQNLFVRGLHPRNAVNEDGDMSISGYGRNISVALSSAALLLHCDIPISDKRDLAAAIVTFARDTVGRTEEGAKWPAGNSPGGGLQQYWPAIMVAAMLTVGHANASVFTAWLNDVGRRFPQAGSYKRLARLNYLTPPSSGYQPYPEQIRPPFEGGVNWRVLTSGDTAFANQYAARYKTNYNLSQIGMLLAYRLAAGGWAAINNDLLTEFCDQIVDYTRSVPGGWSSRDTEYPAFVRAMVEALWPLSAISTGVPAVVSTKAESLVIATDTSPSNLTYQTQGWVWYGFDKQISLQFVPPASAFTCLVDGVAAVVSEVMIRGRGLGVRLSAPFAAGAAVTLAYDAAAAGATAARSIGGGLVASIAAQAATNLTGQLSPAVAPAPIVISTPRNYLTLTKPPLLPAGAYLDQFLIGMRFKKLGAFIANGALMARDAGSTSAFYMYMASTTALRGYWRTGVARWDIAGIFGPSDEGTDITFWLKADLSKATVGECYAARKNGANVAVASASYAGPYTGTARPRAEELWPTAARGPTFLCEPSAAGDPTATSGSDPFGAAARELWFAYGDSAGVSAPPIPFAADLSGAVFGSAAAWGDHGELVLPGYIPQIYIPFNAEDANSGAIPNRGLEVAVSAVTYRDAEMGDAEFTTI